MCLCFLRFLACVFLVPVSFDVGLVFGTQAAGDGMEEQSDAECKDNVLRKRKPGVQAF